MTEKFFKLSPPTKGIFLREEQVIRFWIFIQLTFTVNVTIVHIFFWGTGDQLDLVLELTVKLWRWT